jgi:hypothetical protein
MHPVTVNKNKQDLVTRILTLAVLLPEKDQAFFVMDRIDYEGSHECGLLLLFN